MCFIQRQWSPRASMYIKPTHLYTVRKHFHVSPTKATCTKQKQTSLQLKIVWVMLKTPLLYLFSPSIMSEIKCTTTFNKNSSLALISNIPLAVNVHAFKIVFPQWGFSVSMHHKLLITASLRTVNQFCFTSRSSQENTWLVLDCLRPKWFWSCSSSITQLSNGTVSRGFSSWTQGRERKEQQWLSL